MLYSIFEFNQDDLTYGIERKKAAQQGGRSGQFFRCRQLLSDVIESGNSGVRTDRQGCR